MTNFIRDPRHAETLTRLPRDLRALVADAAGSDHPGPTADLLAEYPGGTASDSVGGLDMRPAFRRVVLTLLLASVVGITVAGCLLVPFPVGGGRGHGHGHRHEHRRGW